MSYTIINYGIYHNSSLCSFRYTIDISECLLTKTFLKCRSLLPTTLSRLGSVLFSFLKCAVVREGNAGVSAHSGHCSTAQASIYCNILVWQYPVIVPPGTILFRLFEK